MFYCPTPQNSQDFQSETPKIFNYEAVFYNSSSIITSSPPRKVPRFTRHITSLPTLSVQPQASAPPAFPARHELSGPAYYFGKVFIVLYCPLQ